MARILLVCKPDKGANGVRSLKIKNFLQEHGHEVILHKIGDGDIKITKKATRQKLRKKLIPKPVRNLLFLGSVTYRAYELARKVKNYKCAAIICETEDSAACFFFLDKNIVRILDSPAPWIPEWHLSGDLSFLIKPLAYRIERRLYKRADALCFHWENYTKFVKENIYNGDNIFTMNWGCEVHNKRAQYSPKPKIVFLGKLDGYWNNLTLLAKLSKIYEIDVYGSPRPSKTLGLNYKGYALSTDILADYQFGLITISNDKLRQQSFSSKQLEYMSYGLPVLTPEWRQDPLLSKYSIYYNEQDFLDEVNKYSSRKNWQHMSDSSFGQAAVWSWDNTLQVLLEILEKE
jgi:hypothetical protein